MASTSAPPLTLPIKAALSHLFTSSHALATTAPQISAHLMSEFFSLAELSSAPLSTADQRAACACCGTVRIPGITGSYRTRLVGGKKRKRENRKRGETKARDDEKSSVAISQMVYTCKACGKDTVEDVPRPRGKFGRAQRRNLKSAAAAAVTTSSMEGEFVEGKKAATTPTTTTLVTVTKTMKTTTLESSSSSVPGSPAPALAKRDRKKAKKGGSLSAILAKEKERKQQQAGSGFGLGLMDLMEL